MSAPQPPIPRIVVSYAHDDNDFCQSLVVHLRDALGLIAGGLAVGTGIALNPFCDQRDLTEAGLSQPQVAWMDPRR